MRFLLEEHINSHSFEPEDLDFNSNLRLADQNLSTKILEIFKERSQLFYDDLIQNPETVVLVEAETKKHLNHKIRRRESLPPLWYLNLHRSFGREIKSKGKITNRYRNNWTSNYQRCRALISFQRIISGNDLIETHSSYDMINRGLIFEDLVDKNRTNFGIDLDVICYFLNLKQNKSSKIPF